MPSHFLPFFGRKTDTGIVFLHEAVQSNRRLDRIAVGYQTKHKSSGGSFFGGSNPKQAGLVPEHLSFGADDFGKIFCLFVLGGPYIILWPVEKNIFFEGMAVEIKKIDYFTGELFLQFLHIVPQINYFRK